MPAEMRAERRWLAWRYEWEPPTPKHPEGSWSKVPYNARTGRHASTTQERTWSDCETAWRAYQNSLASTNPYSGIGFVLGDGWVGLDLDGCRSADDGGMDQWALDVLKRIHGYCEVSPSGTGVHVITRGAVPEGRRERGAVPEGRREWDDPTHEHTGVAIYPEGRYFAITGCQLADSVPIDDRSAELASLHAWLSSNGASTTQRIAAPAGAKLPAELEQALRRDATLDALWRGDISSYPSASEADQALANRLVPICKQDPARIEALFSQSGLARDKWLKRSDYRKRTIETALQWHNKPRPTPPKIKPLEFELGAAVYRHNDPPVSPVVEDLIYPGFTLFAGRPKSGKSWFMLQMALSVASGKPLAGWLRSQSGRVLYLALEEPRKRTTARMHKLYHDAGNTAALDNIRFVYRTKPMLPGGLAELDASLTECPAELVIIDTLRAFSRATGGRTDDIVQRDYLQMDLFRQLAEKHSTSVVGVDHTRKTPGDLIDIVLSTTGATAGCDAVCGMVRTLATARTRTFYRKKVVLTSSPTVPRSRIEQAWSESDRRVYELPCCHCGQFQRLTWEHVELFGIHP